MYALATSRQVEELQELVEKLKVELATKGDSTGQSIMEALELEVRKNTWRKLERMAGEKEAVADPAIEVTFIMDPPSHTSILRFCVLCSCRWTNFNNLLKS